MSTPSAHLPKPFDVSVIQDLLSSIGYDIPKRIALLKATAQYHIFYVLTYSTDVITEKLYGIVEELSSKETDLVLRISGSHIPRLKTENEAAMLSWIKKNTKIPVPAVLYFDSSEKNVLGREHMIMTRVPGVAISDVYDTLTTDQMDSILDQLTAVLLELYKIPLHHIGGFRIDTTSSTIVPGPVCEETFWQIPDVEEFWPPTENFETLNIQEFYETYTDYVTAHIGKYITAIQIHDKLAWLQRIPQLTCFLNKINSPELKSKLNDVLLRLAHCDLHFANILIDPATAQITGILDWEFSQVLPCPLWNRGKPFLWNGREGEKDRTEKNRLYVVWEERVKKTKEGREILKNMKWEYEEQGYVFQVWNYLRSIVEVCPRGQRVKESREWWKEVEKNLDVLGVAKVTEEEDRI
jgi:hypothetical protein